MRTDNLLICTVIISAAIFMKDISCTNPSVISSVGKMVIDTDPGADDAAAILLAIGAEKRNEALEILAITCVNGNTDVDRVALNVLKTLKVVDRLNIPVYKGASHPLLRSKKSDNYFGQDGFGDFYYPDPPSTSLIREEHAVNVLIELVKSNPGQVTLLALGPLTNVALAIRLYPSFLDELQQLIVMGGSTDGTGNVRPGIEFNFSMDPAAAFAVFNTSTSRPTTLIPYNTARRIPMTKEFKTVVRKLNNTITWFVSASASAQRNSNVDSSATPDTVAAIVALTSGSIVTKSAEFYVDIVYYGESTAGITIVDYSNITGKAPNVNLIQDIDVEEFKRLILRYYS